MTLDQLTARHVNEHANLVKQHETELKNLTKQHHVEVLTKGSSPELDIRHDREVDNLKKRQFIERANIVQRHEQEFQQFETRRISKNNFQADHIVEQRAIIQTQRREESENTRLNWEGGEKEDRESILKRLTTVFKKDKGPERDH